MSGGFTLLAKYEIDEFDVNKIKEDSSKGKEN